MREPKVGEQWRCKQDGRVVTVVSVDTYNVYVKCKRKTAVWLNLFVRRYEPVEVENA